MPRLQSQFILAWISLRLCFYRSFWWYMCSNFQDISKEHWTGIEEPSNTSYSFDLCLDIFHIIQCASLNWSQRMSMVKICVIIIIISQLLLLLSLRTDNGILCKFSCALSYTAVAVVVAIVFISHLVHFILLFIFWRFKICLFMSWLLVCVCIGTWCKIMTSENDYEFNGKEPIFHNFLTSWVVFSIIFTWYKHQRVKISLPLS